MRKDDGGTNWLTLKLPSGRLLYYNEPEIRDTTYGSLPTAMGINSYTKQWERMKIIPGRMTENIVQALARDVLLGAKVKLRNRGYDLIVSVHDEIVAEVDESFSQKDLEQMYKIMCAFPSWAPDLPLRAEGAIRRRYAKI
jgi:DNA polymerase